MSTSIARQPNIAQRFFSRVKILLEMIKFEHTIFSTPFALASAAVAANGIPHLRVIGWILVALVGARSAAMAFNRIVDAKFDALNPRTSMRAIPAGQVTVRQAWIFTIVSCALLILAAYMLNPLALELSPVALLFALGYSYTKRFTSLSHLFLGIASAIAPLGAWVAVRGSLELAPFILGLAIVFWLFGFDIIYALQDVEFDRANGLFSIPAKFGNAKALLLSRIGHTVMVAFLIGFGFAAHLHAIYFVGATLVACLIAYEQSLVKPNDLSKLNFAFFNLNGYISLGFFAFTLADVLILGK